MMQGNWQWKAKSPLFCRSNGLMFPKNSFNGLLRNKHL